MIQKGKYTEITETCYETPQITCPERLQNNLTQDPENDNNNNNNIYHKEC